MEEIYKMDIYLELLSNLDAKLERNFELLKEILEQVKKTTKIKTDVNGEPLPAYENGRD